MASVKKPRKEEIKIEQHMVNMIVNNRTEPNFTGSIKKVLFVLSGIFLCIVALTVFQDFLESRRRGIDFNLDESILFKIVWFLFIPILFILYKRLKNKSLDNHIKATAYIVSAIAIHLLILPFVGMFFSVLFYEGRYDLYKFFSYTLAHDFYKLLIIYTSFVLGYKYFSKPAHIIDSKESEPILNTIVINNEKENVIANVESINIKEDKPTLNTLVINNGKENVIVDIEDIIQITSATPYIFVHLKGKKHLYTETLKSICEQLDSNVFVRVHKSTVVNIAKVSSFKSRLNGDYDLLLTNGDSVRLSRTYAADFKKYFNTG